METLRIDAKEVFKSYGIRIILPRIEKICGLNVTCEITYCTDYFTLGIHSSHIWDCCNNDMIHYANINKIQKAQLDSYINKLGITTNGELFVLEHILKRDWGRDILLQDITMIKYNHPKCTNLIWVKCQTRNGNYK